MKRIVIYSRKTNEGDNTEKQIEICKEYIHRNLCNAEQYDVSVESTSLENLMKTEDTNPYDCIVVDKLNRICKNVIDFSNLMEKLNSAGTEFISVYENIDTSTPIGKTIINIAAVFAALELENTIKHE